MSASYATLARVEYIPARQRRYVSNLIDHAVQFLDEATRAGADVASEIRQRALALAFVLLKIVPLFKDSRFRHEKEIRLVEGIPAETPDIPLRFRANGPTIVPYVELSLRTHEADSATLPLRSIRISRALTPSCVATRCVCCYVVQSFRTPLSKRQACHCGVKAVEIAARPNSAQKLTRPGAGPPAEPASQLTRITAARRQQHIRRNGGRRRAASASARGPRPRSLARSVGRTKHQHRTTKQHLNGAHISTRRTSGLALQILK